MSDAWIQTNVLGVKKLTDNLAHLSAEIRFSGAEKATRAGAVHIMKEAKTNCKSERLKATMTVMKIHKKGAPKIKYFITHVKKHGIDPFFAHFVEFGPVNQPGGWDIWPKTPGGRLGYMGRLGPYQRHKGYDAQPYMRPAFDDEASNSIDIMAKRLDKFIHQVHMKK